jgi:hypothetical protein
LEGKSPDFWNTKLERLVSITLVSYLSYTYIAASRRTASLIIIALDIVRCGDIEFGTDLLK